MSKLFYSSALLLFLPVSFFFGLIISLFIYHNQHKQAVLGAQTSNVAYAALPTTQNNFKADITEQDGRSEHLRQFLAKYNSPLEPYSNDIVAAADEYGLDFRLIVAIGMQESNLCKKIPEGSHNCWGFGIYGDTITKFPDYKVAIYTVTKTLATKYKKNGLVTPNQIMTMYTPSSNGSWAFGVNHFMDALE